MKRANDTLKLHRICSPDDAMYDVRRIPTNVIRNFHFMYFRGLAVCPKPRGWSVGQRFWTVGVECF